jgi:hypothetical protein
MQRVCNEFARRISPGFRIDLRGFVMRFVLLVAGILAGGCWAAGVSQGVLPRPAQAILGLFGHGSDPAKAGTGGVNLSQTYNNVMKQVTSGKNDVPAEMHWSPVVVQPGGFQSMNTANINMGPNAGNGIAPGLFNQMQQNNQRIQDMAAYARNPAGWHGMPPH